MISNSNRLDSIKTEVLYLLSSNNINTDNVIFGELEINCFSICFWIKFTDKPDSFYVKMPKIIFYDKNNTDLCNISTQDRRLAVDEFNSLRYLDKNWEELFNVKFVDLVGYIEKYNIIITRKINSEVFYKKYRFFDKYGTPKTYKVDPILDGMERFGKSLSKFHSKSSLNSKIRSDDVIIKFEYYMKVLMGFGVNYNRLKRLINYLSEHESFSSDSVIVDNIKGIDVRQIFIDDNGLEIIDPGKIHRGYKEVDLARFIVTCRILYWGTWAILFKRVPHNMYVDRFIGGYYCDDKQKTSKKILSLFIVKEILKHWKMAHISLDKRGWSKITTVFLKKIYIDPFYSKILNNELIVLE